MTNVVPILKGTHHLPGGAKHMMGGVGIFKISLYMETTTGFGAMNTIIKYVEHLDLAMAEGLPLIFTFPM